MSYLVPSEFVTKMVDAGESKIFMSTRDTVIRAYMAGAILALAAVFAVTVTVQTGFPIIGAILFPVGFCMLYLLGFDLLTGVFVLSPLALIDKRPGVTIGGVLRNWGLVFVGNFLGAQVFFHRHGVIGTPFDRGVVAHDHAIDPADAADARHDACRRRVAPIHAQSRQRRDFQKRRAWIQQCLHPHAGQQLAAFGMPLARALIAAERGNGHFVFEVGDKLPHRLGIGFERGRGGGDGGF